MKIQVEYMSQLRTRTGCGEEAFELPEGATMEGLLRAIAKRHGEGVRGLLFDEAGAAAATVLCFVASQQVDQDHPLRDGDGVTLMTPISGG